MLPQLRFERDGGRYLVTAMANSGAHDGARGPFTLVDVEMPSDSGQEIRVERRTVGRPADPSAPGTVPIEELRAFGDAFRVRAGGAQATARLLEAPVREKLTASRLPRLEARVEGQKVSVRMDGIARGTRGADRHRLAPRAELIYAGESPQMWRVASGFPFQGQGQPGDKGSR